VLATLGLGCSSCGLQPDGGKKKAYVASIRKILCIIHHLLVTGEEYVEKGFVKRFKVRMMALEGLPLDKMARILVGAAYLVQGPA